jgi:hypothetical protein
VRTSLLSARKSMTGATSRNAGASSSRSRQTSLSGLVDGAGAFQHALRTSSAGGAATAATDAAAAAEAIERKLGGMLRPRED